MVLGEVGLELAGQLLGAVATDAGETDFQLVALRADGFDVQALYRWLGWGDDGFGSEVKGDAEDVGVLHVELSIVVELVVAAAEGAADYLFAEELGAEGSYA